MEIFTATSRNSFGVCPTWDNLKRCRRLKERFTGGSVPGTGPLKRPFTPDTFDTPQEDSRQKDAAEEQQGKPKVDDDQVRNS